MIYSRIVKIDPQSSALLLGPRGTGKTQWVKDSFPQALYFDLLDDQIYRELMAQPTRLGDRIPQSHQDWIIIDEIQKVPALLNEVHRLIEHRKLRFILTGSSARKLRQKGTNLLAGRALTYAMHPLTVVELKDTFNLETSLRYGHLPLAVTHADPIHYLASYVSTYLREEILQEGLTRQLAVFTRFLETASFSQGQVLNYSNIARELGMPRQTVTQYFDILEDLLIAYRLPSFSKHAKRETVAHAKFYFFDVGVYRTIRPKGPLDSPADMDGPALETLFLQEARALNDYYRRNYQFYYWRTRAGEEVDVIAYGEHGLQAFEIKRKAQLSPQDFKSLRLFARDYPPAKLYMLYGGTRRYHEAGIEVWPYAEALKHLSALL